MENGEEKHTGLPSNWVSDGVLYWSNSSTARREFKNRLVPQPNWLQNEIEQIVVIGGKYKYLFCCRNNEVMTQLLRC